ncbi:hypothetical protein C8Q80DRAFT_1222116 [Daedaleopsis nitida]|nr:hypothetical protein C8Q80DRAFT_1222116 [Daedaleopsis nitida]
MCTGCLRTDDRKRLAFHPCVGTASTTTAMAIVLASLNNHDAMIHPTLQVSRCAPNVCVVYTKIDLVPRDYSQEHDYRFDLDCFAGLYSLRAHIGTSHQYFPIVHQHSAIAGQQILYIPFRTVFQLPRQISSDISAELPPSTTWEDICRLMENDTNTARYQQLLNRLGVPDAQRTRASARVPHGLHRGAMLLEYWDSVSRFTQFRIACTLRLYIKQLRMLTRANVSTVDDGFIAGTFFDRNRYRLNRRKRLSESTPVDYARYQAKAPPPLPRPTIDRTPVLTHGNLNMSSIMLYREGGVWILDWAGFYPACIEPLAMRRRGRAPYRSFIAGATTEDEQEFWHNLFSAIHRFRSS